MDTPSGMCNTKYRKQNFESGSGYIGQTRD